MEQGWHRIVADTLQNRRRSSAMTTNTTNSQATGDISIQDLVAEHRKDPRKSAALDRAREKILTEIARQAVSIDTPKFQELLWDYNYSVSEFGASYSKDELFALIAHIDAKLAQAFNDGAIEGRIHQRGIDDARIQAAESRLSIETKWATDMQAKAVALSDRLAEIQRGVEKLQGYDKARILVAYADVLALLQPQGQASDTSGLPG